MTKDLLIVSKKWATNRSAHTSVERFCTLLDPDFERYHGQRISLPPGIGRLIKNCTNSQPNERFGYSAPYNSYSFELELWALRQAIMHRPHILFFPYADYDFYFWRFWKNFFPAKLVVWTFFSVQELETRFKNLDHFAAADLILAAGQAQVRYLSERLPKNRVEFFPIGVDTNFFVPPQRKKPSRRIVHVGTNRRDFATLISGLDILYESYPDLQVDLVGVSTTRRQLPERPYLQIHPFLDETGFLALLQQAACAVLCLQDGGSSNSILEMLACGLPVIVTDLDNIRDYMHPQSCLAIPPGNPHALFQACCTLFNDPALCGRMALAARAHAQNYSWESLKNLFESKLANLTMSYNREQS